MTWILLWLVAAAVVAVIVGNIIAAGRGEQVAIRIQDRSEEHTSELQSLL